VLQLLEFAWPGDRGALHGLSGGHALFSNVTCLVVNCVKFCSCSLLLCELLYCSRQGCVIWSSGTFNMVEYGLNTMRRTIRNTLYDTPLVADAVKKRSGGIDDCILNPNCYESPAYTFAYT